ncbi:SHOCT domain-containing protein [Anoxybacter fermentans]|nr:SHOCT domain-containing protein [Anoxybacter fermentans]
MLLFWGAVIFGIFYLIRSSDSLFKRDSEKNKPLEILKERYARGEIDKETFLKMKEDLKE